MEKVDRYWVGDPHFGHELVAKTRGFFKQIIGGEWVADVDAHDWAVYNSIIETVPDGSTLVITGDLSHQRNYLHGLDFVYELKKRYRVELISGNHDWIHPLYGEKGQNKHQDYLDAFDRVDERRNFRIGDYRVLVSHLPVLGDRGPEARYSEWRYPESVLENDKTWVLCAHTHGDTILDLEKPKHIITSWDVKRRPITDEEINRVVLQQAGKKFLHERAHWGDQEKFFEMASKFRYSTNGRKHQ